MNETPIGGNSPELDHLWKAEDSEIITTDTPGSPSPADDSKDTVSRSDDTRREKMDAHDPRKPRLQNPSYLQYLIHCQTELSHLADDLIDHWSSVLQKESDELQAELKSPRYRAWQEQRSAGYIDEQQARSGKDLIVPTKDATEVQATVVTATQEERDRYTRLLDRYYFVAGLQAILLLPQAPEKGEGGPTALLAIGAGFASDMTPNPESGPSQPEVQAFREVWKKVAPEADKKSETAGWLAAMWIVGLAYQRSAQNIAAQSVDPGARLPERSQFARELAVKVADSLEDASFEDSLKALLSPQAPASEEVAALAAKGKAALASLALALVCKMEANAQPWEDKFTALLKNEAHGDETEEKLLAVYRKTMQAADVAEQQEIEGALIAYARSAPMVEGLLDQQRAFEALSLQGDFDSTLVDKRPI